MSSTTPDLDDAPRDPAPGRGAVAEAARRIEDLVLRGEVAPGQRLNELALSRRLDTSRATLREAVRGLEQMGLVEVVPNRGVVVRQISLREALDLYELRAALLRAAVRLAARRAPATALERLRARNAAMRVAAADGRFGDYYRGNLDFHAGLLEAADSPSLSRAYHHAVKQLHLFRRRALGHPAQLDLSLREHDAILEALAAGDAEAAGAAAERHVLLGRDRMLDTLDDAPAPPQPARTRSNPP